MERRRLRSRMLLLLTVWCSWGLSLSRLPALPEEPQEAGQQTDQKVPATAPGIIKTQTNLVLVDAIATDKKGNYIRDLEAKDFHVYEDSKEQKIVSFSRTADPAGPSASDQKRYLVLLF